MLTGNDISAGALDIEPGDTAELKLINADGNLSSANWAAANGGTAIGLSAGAGETVYLQWCLSGTGATTDDYLAGTSTMRSSPGPPDSEKEVRVE